MSEFLIYDTFPAENHEATFKSRTAERRRQKFEKINFFIARHGLIGSIRQGKARRMALLDIPTLDKIDPAVLDKHLAQRLKAEETDIFNNCFEIAHTAHTDKTATGVLAANNDTRDFVGWGSHCINYDLLKDSSVLATDLTARENIAGQDDGQFDVLALRAPNLKKLLSQVGELYGGDWHKVNPDDY